MNDKMKYKIKEIIVKKYNNILPEFIETEIKDYFRRHSSVEKKLRDWFSGGVNFERSKKVKEVIKEIKRNLRIKSKFYSKESYSKASEKETEFNVKKNMKRHVSIDERDSYEKIKEAIVKNLGTLNLGSIVDLGCGLNPIEFSRIVEFDNYLAVDVDVNVVEEVNEFFKMNRINGKAIAENILDVKGEFTTCVALKVLSLLDNKGRKNAERVFHNIKAKQYIVSFSTVSYSGKPKGKRRIWFENMIERLRLSYSYSVLKNEIFYFVKRKENLRK